MADEGGASVNNSLDEGETQQENQSMPNSTFFNSSTVAEDSVAVSSSSHSSSSQAFTSSVSNDNSTVVSSSGHIGCTSQGMVGMSRLSHNPFAIKTSVPTRSVADSTENKELRPIVAPPTLKLGSSDTSDISTSNQDNVAAASAPKIVLRPSALSIQAEKLKMLNKHDSGSKQEGKENSSDESNVAKNARTATKESNGKMSKSEIFASGIGASTEIASPLKTLPVAESSFNTASKSSEEQTSPNGSFIFGQNLHERVLNYDTCEQPTWSTDTPNLTFEEAALQKEELEKMERENQEEKLKSLSESAKEYESKQVKRKFEEVAVITGEEEESNVLQMNCKLFAFDKVGMMWLERGRGILRLNDRECNGHLQSRVVMRTQGSLRVVLNTKVWAGMSVEHPSVKTVRLTAYDPQGVKVFLVMAQPKDAEQLFHALDWRVTTLKGKSGTESMQHFNINEGESRIEEATSSSNLPNASSLDDSVHSPPCKIQVTETGTFGADSSSETSFVPQNSTRESGNADSTDVQS